MSDVHTGFSRPSQLLIDRSLVLCKVLLGMENSFYPFAAIYENGRVGCLFADDYGIDNPGEMQLLEHLQWRVIDNITDNDAYATLVYAAQIEINDKQAQDAIVITLCEPNKPERSVVYPYYRSNQRIILAPPLIEK